MKKLKRGFLLSVEGIDGSGKSTFAKALADYAQQHAIPTILTKEPGSTPLGNYLRNLLQEQTINICPLSEFFLFAADRAQHIRDVIQPALQNNMLVISDRMADSSVVYQGYGRGLDITLINTINTWAMNAIQPDYTFYIKVDAQTAWQRLQQRKSTPTAFEQESRAFFERLIVGFETMFSTRSNVITLDGTQQPHDITNKAITWLQNQLLT